MATRRKSTPRTSADDAGAEPLGRRSARLRLRAAWMYYVEEMTQSAIAEALGIGRVTVVRLLADARALHEVKISLGRHASDLLGLEMTLQKTFGLREAVVAPVSSHNADPMPAIGAATGHYITDFLKPNMRIGVGWGRTLLNTLSFIDDAPVPGLAVVSLLGGISAVRRYNPAEFAWRFSQLFNADCYLIAAPALVDSIETKRALIERCGLGSVFQMSDALDAVLLSVGEMSRNSTSFVFDYFTENDRTTLIEKGAVGDVLYNFYDESGEIVDHPINSRAMSASIEQLRRTPNRILTSGGNFKVEAVLGAIRLLQPTTLITDEVTAEAILNRVGVEVPSSGISSEI
ncbi:DNA-binding transcriptional regulator LsrR, DeoR family [Pseudoxanthobacter soli DSM 19599]|uniref:DNA-binding transcriptional regulator LsrR, DeoR family n=1 Tax=Pseudoxanthobacter soli DSM 19599 TaxID=1123029 RepID=A0A1M7ZR96_9HYPH|nr:sugar-binding transcriptional regulator [Pseudoxanthobacter soli]SHO67352.1 DNA-binding transcriptional regulator LsrR, DeoR family [Pseudoxanthobacter soli DSM 19599]